MTFAHFLSTLHHLYHHTSFFEIFGIFSQYVVKPNENVYDICHSICVKSSYYHNRKTSHMTIILFTFMSDTYLFRVCLMRDVLPLLPTILYDLWVKLYEYLMRRCEKTCQKAWLPVNIKTVIFNLQYICNTKIFKS